MLGRIGTTELLVVLAIALLIFGPANLPKLGKAMGQTISSFKKGRIEGLKDDENKAEPSKDSPEQ